MILEMAEGFYMESLNSNNFKIQRKLKTTEISIRLVHTEI